MTYAKVVLTDSGGIQEETTILGVRCLTLREDTERPVTCEMGTNQLVGTDTKATPRGSAFMILDSRTDLVHEYGSCGMEKQLFAWLAPLLDVFRRGTLDANSRS